MSAAVSVTDEAIDPMSPLHEKTLIGGAFLCDRPALTCSSSATVSTMQRIPQRELRNDVSAVLRRVMAGEQLRVTVAGRDAADLVPIEDAPSWTAGSRARDLIAGAQADPGLSAELDRAFPDTTDQL